MPPRQRIWKVKLAKSRAAGGPPEQAGLLLRTLTLKGGGAGPRIYRDKEVWSNAARHVVGMEEQLCRTMDTTVRIIVSASTTVVRRIRAGNEARVALPRSRRNGSRGETGRQRAGAGRL
jgi:hypothetical protein